MADGAPGPPPPTPPAPHRWVARKLIGVLGLETRAARQRATERLAETRTELRTAAKRLARSLEARDELMQRVDVLRAELDAVRAADGDDLGLDRPNLGYVFIVTYGRSGSTLLQGILSSAPGVIIRGENGGLLHHLFHFHRNAAKHRDRLAGGSPLPTRHPWWGIDGYRDETAMRGFRRLMLETVLRPDPDTHLVGFKEIDWLPDELPAVLEFTASVFPGARFVLNTRNLADVAKSKWWARNPNALAELHVMEKQYVEAIDGLGDAAYHVRYDDFVADPLVLRGLFEWLGIDFDEPTVRAVMDVRHSY